jgi:hypothetical protein
MSYPCVPDCLVLKIEEIDTTLKQLDTTVYILYDKEQHKYVIRGRRRCTPEHESSTYSFDCEYANDLVDFLKYIICKENTINEVLYNYDNLPATSNEITFEFLQENDERTYEISGYNGLKCTKKRLLRNLRMLRNVFNYYN